MSTIQVEKPKRLLKFNFGGNAKLAKEIVTFSLPSGFTCPGADTCLAKVNVKTGKIEDGPNQQFRCFSAISELRPAVRRQRWYNFELLRAARTKDKIKDLLINSVPKKAKIVRIHVGGDFYSQAYFDAWAEVAALFPDCIFYAYTKSIHFVKAYTDLLPGNFRITLSQGGKFDSLISELIHEEKRTDVEEENEEEEPIVPEYLFGVAEVLGHPDEATAKGLTVDHDDSHAIAGRQHFALLLHGQQPAGSEAAKKIKKMNKEDIKYSYPSK